MTKGIFCSRLMAENDVFKTKGINTCYSKVVADDLEDVYFKTPFNSNDWSNEKFELDGQKVYKHGVDLTVKTIKDFLKKKTLAMEQKNY